MQKLIDEKQALDSQVADAYDFLFPPKDDYVIRYDASGGDSLYFETSRFESPYFKKQTLWKLFVGSEGELKLQEIKDENASCSTNLKPTTNGNTDVIFSALVQLRARYVCNFDEFNRMPSYDTYIKYRTYYRKLRWRRSKGEDWPKPFRCDAMKDKIDDRSILWGYPDLSRLDLSRAIPISFANPNSMISYRMITDYSDTLFPDTLCLFDESIGSFSEILRPGHFEQIKNELKLDKTEPLLYRMAEFYDPLKKRIYFIGTFQTPLSMKPITTMIFIHIDSKTFGINELFAIKGIMKGFNVHVDSPPVVDRNANCAVVLSCTEPEILVICLETFACIQIDLHKWVTKGFLDRWNEDKKRTCMAFLSKFTNLVFFPRLSHVDYRNKISQCDKFMPKSTIVNWDRLKKEMIEPFLLYRRPTK